MHVDLFKPLFDEEKLDSNFRLIAREDHFDAAKAVINEIFNSWNGFDNHFASEFQTTGFNSRLWELYLYVTFRSLGFTVEKCPDGRPDFLLTKNGIPVYVEAVTTNPDIDNDDYIPSAFDKEGPEVFFFKLRTALLKKLKKKYWELPWVKGTPLLLAIAPFHSPEALNVTDFEVRKYLYGVTIEKKLEASKIIVNEMKTDVHIFGERKLSNFYDIPLTANFSGVLYSNTGTMGKFMRIGYQLGYGKDMSAFFYSGSCHNYAPDSLGISQFMFPIKRGKEIGFKDEWRFGLSLFHNDKALSPIGYDLFDLITQVKYDPTDGLLTKHIFFHPYNAKNLRTILVPDNEDL
jgi:hypothetical protein